MAKILINDGLNQAGIELLEKAGHELHTTKIPQEELMTRLQEFDGICVRSATKVRKELIEACPNLKFIGRGGVGLDNIDVDVAKSRGIAVINTPAASSRSVAELVFAHMLSISRFLHTSNREMPIKGNTEFEKLKKNYSEGVELEGKTLGIVGLGRIGQEAAKIALGMGMKVVGVDPYLNNDINIKMTVGTHTIENKIEVVSMDKMLPQADYITLHTPYTGAPVLSKEEFTKMKKGVFVIDAARGGTIDEIALIDAIDNGIVSAAGLDVFESEPDPRIEILTHPKISITPHIGASTGEAQEKIGTELASKIIELFL